MGIACTRSRKVEPLCQIVAESVFFLKATTIVHFNRVYHVEHMIARRHLQHLKVRGLAGMSALPVCPPVWVCHNHRPFFPIELVLDECCSVHTKDILAETVYEYVTLFSSDLATWQDKEVMSLREIIDFTMVPEAVMVSYAHTIQSDALSLLDQIIGVEKAVDRRGVGVRMYVYYQVGCAYSRLQAR